MENNKTDNIEKIISYLLLTIILIVFVIYLIFYFILFFYSPYSILMRDAFGIDIFVNFQLSEIVNQLNGIFTNFQLSEIFNQLSAIFNLLLENFTNFIFFFISYILAILVVNLIYGFFFNLLLFSRSHIIYDNKLDNISIISLVFCTLFFFIAPTPDSFFTYENFFLNFLIYCLVALFQSLAIIYTKKNYYFILIVSKFLSNRKKLNSYAEEEYHQKSSIFDLLIVLLCTPILFFLVIYFMFIQDLKPLYEGIKESLKKIS
ncbi:hypothetical protein [Geminocystis herdmanii]|uniref:hypothetical protein n=1 Tax=Geminocystis herdmanii TaxID=669359 RepID=UPI000349B761|nr:hypothetical protein [Geminocystis herdmanii]